jgi:hypothetical protein
VSLFSRTLKYATPNMSARGLGLDFENETSCNRISWIKIPFYFLRILPGPPWPLNE